jgi:Tfp pilus assembly protein PilF
MSDSAANVGADDVTRIGPYLIQDVLGAGPHGTVYLALHEERGRRCVLKRLHKPAAGGRPGEKFGRIARVVVALAHPGLADVSHMLLHGGHVVIVSEFVSGRTLTQVIAEHGPLEPREVVSLARQICMGLQYAHQRCVYHTSLHPGNVFLLPDGSLKLTDLAIAALYGHSVGKRPAYLPRQRAFLAPEFRANGVIHPPSDIYSLGMTLYSALTGALILVERSGERADAGGRFAYLEVGDASRVREAQSGPDLSRLPEGVPEVLRHALATALATDPADRFGSVNAFSAILRGAPAAPIANRDARPTDEVVTDAPAPASAAGVGPRSRVCAACHRPVSPAGRVCLACGLVQSDAPEMPAPVSYFQDRGRKLLARHDLTGAEKAYGRAIERDPDVAALHNELGDVLAVANRFADAAKSYRRALKLDPTDDDAWHDLGLSLVALHRYKEAARALNHAIDLTECDEVRLSARLHLGVIAAEEGRQEDAIALWRQVLAEDPGLSAVRMALASTFASMRRYDEAQEELRSVISVEPENSQAQNLMARVRERSEVERLDTDDSFGVINDMGGGSTYLGMGFDWGRWL